ncbi:MAG TPA: GNAT family N-acyltransferase [Candidatus Acidoferrales bacterium]|nr:GNAT family N-acyltransferase [Candidatus Acidoferrales bacterium]
MRDTAVLVHDCRDPLAATNLFRVGMATTLDDVVECQRLRYLVFNCELGEGLDISDRTGLDRDRFDFICDHLMVRDAATGKLAGTYRMQSGYRARGNLGYYGEELFDFGPFEEMRGEVLELGRACVHLEYRNTNVLHMLWKGIARYALSCRARYLIGCSSLSSQNEDEGMALYAMLKEKYLVAPLLRTNPVESHKCRSSSAPAALPGPPRLFRAYLDISARICGPPAIDREFKTIDFLTLVDLQALPDRVRMRFF